MGIAVGVLLNNSLAALWYVGMCAKSGIFNFF